MGIKMNTAKKPMAKLDKDVLRFVGANPGTWNLYSSFKKHTDQAVDVALSTLQMFGYLKHIGTAQGRTTWHLSDRGKKVYLGMVLSLGMVDFVKQPDGSYRLTTPQDTNGPGSVKKVEKSWFYTLVDDKKKKLHGPAGTRNAAAEELLRVYYADR